MDMLTAQLLSNTRPNKDSELVEVRAQKLREHEAKFKLKSESLLERKLSAAYVMLHYSRDAQRAIGEILNKSCRKDGVTPRFDYEMAVVEILEPYVKTLERAGIDIDLLLGTGFGHDCPEDDAELTKKKMSRDIGKKIENLFVEAAKEAAARLTKEIVDRAFILSRNHENGMKVKRRSNRKHLSAVFDDAVTFLVKCADRLHNIITLIHLKPKRQVEYFRNTQDFVSKAKDAVKRFPKIEKVLKALIGKIELALDQHLLIVAEIRNQGKKRANASQWAIVKAFDEAGLLPPVRHKRIAAQVPHA